MVNLWCSWQQRIFELSDIGKLCDVFLIEWKYIEPFQYNHIQKMSLLSTDGADKQRGSVLQLRPVRKPPEKGG